MKRRTLRFMSHSLLGGVGAIAINLLAVIPSCAGTWHIVYSMSSTIGSSSTNSTSAVDAFSYGWHSITSQVGSVASINGFQTFTTTLYYSPQNSSDQPPSTIYLVDAPCASIEADTHNHIINWGSGFDGLTGSANNGYADPAPFIYDPWGSQYDWGADVAWAYSYGMHIVSVPVDATKSGTIPGSGYSYRGVAVYNVPTLTESVTLTNTIPTQSGVPIQSKVAAGGMLVDYPVVLQAPNPAGRPDLGDGTNQFVYTSDTPDGYLYVPGGYQVMNGTEPPGQQISTTIPWVEPVAWVLNGGQVDLKIEDSIIPNTYTHAWDTIGEAVYVNTPNNGYPGYKPDTWVFKGLPDSFSQPQDGNHSVNLYVSGTKAQSTHIQTFYTGTASNYPGAADDAALYGYGIPNWYHYYEQAYPNDTIYDPDLRDVAGNPHDDCVAIFSWYAVGSEDGPKTIEATMTKMGPRLMTDSPAKVIPVFAIDSQTGYLEVIGEEHISGIFSYLRADAHEAEHIKLALSGDFVEKNTDGTYPPGIIDTDGDCIPDNIESKYHLDPNQSDTTGYFGDLTETVDAGKADAEAICEIAALHAVVQKASAWMYDWSNIGSQYGVWPSYFPIHYIPYNPNEPDSVLPPSNAVTDLP